MAIADLTGLPPRYRGPALTQLFFTAGWRMPFKIQTHPRRNRPGAGAALRLHGGGVGLHPELRHQIPPRPRHRDQRRLSFNRRQAGSTVSPYQRPSAKISGSKDLWFEAPHLRLHPISAGQASPRPSAERENNFMGRFPRVALTMCEQPWANFRSAFSALGFVLISEIRVRTLRLGVLAVKKIRAAGHSKLAGAAVARSLHGPGLWLMFKPC